MSPITISVIVFACVFGGAMLGIFTHSLLPSEHLDTNSKDAVRVAMGLVATTVALVLGLLVASAKGFYDTENSEITQAAANVVLLDRILLHYGPETKEVRVLLRSSVTQMVDLSWQGNESDLSHFKPTASTESIFDKIQELSPQNDDQRFLRTQALGLAIALAQTRWLIFAQKSYSVPMSLLATLVFWLTLLFVSFGLFARGNLTVVVSLFTSALAVSGAIFIILRMYHLAGLIQFSSAPLRAAVAQLGQ